jgi:hypothetical protein
MNIMSSYKKLFLPGFSLALIGMGLSISIEAGFWKWKGNPTWEWVMMGTIGLVIFNTGLSLFGEAVIRASKENKN